MRHVYMPSHWDIPHIIGTGQRNLHSNWASERNNVRRQRNSQKDMGEMKQPPVIMSLSADAGPPSYDLPERRRKSGRTAAPLPRAAPFPSDRLREGQKDLSENNLYRKHPG